jgi:Phosphate-induced protein 1 conserved region
MKLPQGKTSFASVVLFVILAVNFMAAQELQHVDNPGQTADKVPSGHVPGAPQETMEPAAAGPVGQAVVTGNGINYHNGPVMKGTVHAYVIWYGNWAGTGSNTAATKSLIEHFLGTIGGSNIERVNTTYGDTTGNVSGNVSFAGSTTVSSSTNLSDTSLRTTVSNALNSGALPRDANGVYFVLTSSNINETSGFCTQYCGFHTHASLGGVDIKYAFVGNPDRCPSGCEAQRTGPNSPAANVGGADGMANVMSHELEEAISDPDLNAWFDASGQENADKCNFNFGTTSTCTSTSICSAAGKAAASKFNQTFGSNDWLLQQNWRNSGGGACAQHL